MPPFGDLGDQEDSTTVSVLKLLVEERARQLSETRDMLRALSTMRDDAQERSLDIQNQLKEQQGLLKSQPQFAQAIQQEIVALKRDLNDSISDASNAARQTREQSVLLATINKSEKAWHMAALAGTCAVCEAGITKGELLRCAPAAPASSLMLCHSCAQV